jgi:aminocarboxymuconate-semialdehyde decarboxylase
MNGAFWVTGDGKHRTKKTPHQRRGPVLSFFCIGLVYWSLGVGPARAQEKPALQKAFTVDIHCHIATPAAEPLVKDLFTPTKEPFFRFATAETLRINQQLFASLRPKLIDPQERLTDMDRMGIAIQAISPGPNQFYYWTDGELGAKLARMQNDRVAEIVRSHPDRFVGMGTLPLQDPQKAVRELERVVQELGFRAVEISSNINGVDLDAPHFEPFWAKVQELDVLVFVHPIGFTDAERLKDYYLNNVIGQPLEETVFVSRLIFGGVLERYPNLTIVVGHGGGYLPFYPGRMDHAYKVRPENKQHISRPPSEYLKKLYFDSIVYQESSLENLVRFAGSDHVLLGTDYPFDMGETDPVGFINTLRSVSQAEREQILGGNAMRLLKIKIGGVSDPR